MDSYETLQIFIFLVPGFLASIILESIIVRKEKNKFNLIIEALIFSVLIYATMSIFSNIDSIITLDSDTKMIFHLKPFLLASLFSTIYGILFGFLIYKDYIMKFFRWVKITEKDSSDSVWYSALKENEGLATIAFKDGNRLFGKIQFYSDDPDKQYLYLIQPAWVKGNKKTKKQDYIDLDVKGILITPNQEIEYIYFF